MYARTYVKELPRGLAGTLATVDLILPEIRTGRKSAAVLQLAHRAIERVPERDYWGEIEAVHELVKRSVRFTRDPVGIEKITSADALARGVLAGRTVFADCDEFVILEGALLEAVGHQVRPKIIGSAPGQFRHIYLEVQHGGRWVPLDATIKQQPAGYEVAHRYGRSFASPEAPDDVAPAVGDAGLGWVQALVQAGVKAATEVYSQESARKAQSRASRHGFAREMAYLKAESELARQNEAGELKQLDILLKQAKEQSKVALARIAADERIAKLQYGAATQDATASAQKVAAVGLSTRAAPSPPAALPATLGAWVVPAVAVVGLGLVVMLAKR